ncbi:MAG: hypothetical protein EAZ99_05410 [Alphaproteobacteria bacterium]|nr:MAG: hypothetical protein EAZ99_05410 [Alphaproteobacteria bacterium]
MSQTMLAAGATIIPFPQRPSAAAAAPPAGTTPASRLTEVLVLMDQAASTNAQALTTIGESLAAVGRALGETVERLDKAVQSIDPGIQRAVEVRCDTDSVIAAIDSGDLAAMEDVRQRLLSQRMVAQQA